MDPAVRPNKTDKGLNRYTTYPMTNQGGEVMTNPISKLTAILYRISTQITYKLLHVLIFVMAPYDLAGWGLRWQKAQKPKRCEQYE